MADKQVAFVGFGMMGQALLGGCLKNGAIAKGKAWAADPYTKFESIPWVEEYDVKCTRNNMEAIQACDVIVLAVKPFLLESLLQDLAQAGISMAEKLVVSLVSSFALPRLQTLLRPIMNERPRVIRIMPNTPALVGEGATAICAPEYTSKEDLATVEHLMNACGRSWVIPEERMNIWTAFASCGPAYVFEILEAVADAAVVGGIPRTVANEAAAQLLIGSAKMALESGKHVGELKDNVCSPAGSTVAGLEAMRELGVQGSIMKTIKAARTRYDEVDANPNI